MLKFSPALCKDNYDRSVPVRVNINDGPIEGFVHTTDTGVGANVFLGIPFAKPPIDELRFERPEPPTPWTEPLETKYFKSECVPYIKMWVYGDLNSVSEDCLYLNVMAPAKTDNVSLHPVMVYVHGGGFFSTGDSVAEGNNGLFDQVAALKWIHNNIAMFNGDPNKVTLYGQSAGSASVGILSIAPISRDYIHQVVQASGSAVSYWAVNSPTVESSKKLARALGCTSENSSEIKAFLKKQKWKDIIEITSTEFHTNFIEAQSDKKYIGFGPRIDLSFFGGKTIDELIKEAPPKPIVYGLMVSEGAPFILSSLTPSEITEYSKKDVLDTIAKIVPESIVGIETHAIRQELQEFYLERDVPKDGLSKFYLEKHIRLLSDVMFDSAVLYEIEKKLSKKWTMYFYAWNYLNPNLFKATGISGGYHSYDLMYASDEKVFDFAKIEKYDQKITELYAELLSNFVKTGNPSLETLEFPALTKQDRKAFWIDIEPSIKTNVFQDVKEFYEHLDTTYNYSISRGIKKSSSAKY